MVGEFFFGWWNNVCGGRGSAPDAWHSVRLPWVLCGRCEPEAVVRDGVVSCSGCKVSKVSPACLSAAFVSLACRFVLSINRSVHFLPRSSTLLRFYTRRIIIGRFRLRANCVVRCSPLRPLSLNANLHARFSGRYRHRPHRYSSPPHSLLFILSSCFCVNPFIFWAHLADPRCVYDMYCCSQQHMSMDVP